MIRFSAMIVGAEPVPGEKIYSHRLMVGFLQLMDLKAGKSATDAALARIGLERLGIMDLSGFETAEKTASLIDAARAVTGDPDVAYTSGRRLPESLGTLQVLILGATSPWYLMREFGKIESKMSLKTVNTTTRVGRNRFRVEIGFKDGFREKHYVCRNRIGCYESMPLLFGLPYARVEHPECAFEGGERCVYEVQFPDAGFRSLNRVFQAGMLGAVVCGGFWVANPDSALLGAGAIASAFAGLLAFAASRHYSARNSLRWSLMTNEGLSRQNKQLEDTSRQFESLQDLTTSLNESAYTQEIGDKVVATLVKRFGFGSSQLWLLDEAAEFLACLSAEGYSRDLTAFIRNTRFRVGQDWDNPYGLLVQTLEQRKTLVFNDPEEVYAKVTPRTRDFLQALEMSSFILTPLIHQGKAIGILAAEHHGGEKIRNQDRMLFQSISNSIANALVKAGLFEGMERKIEQRTVELAQANQRLLAAQEMAIQSEKLSSLGQMAAGVAHEINNPLNFLVNIMPDVKRDVEGLARIRELAAKAGLDDATAAAIREVEEKYDLEAHLEEKDFVFEKIQKALDKSTRIANSLKVFSRSSAKETVARESFGAMVRDVIELIPQKVKGDTRITVDVPESVAWAVNKNEMEQAILVLVNNAIDATGQKGNLLITSVDSPAEMFVAFKDDGPGIPEAVIKRIFDPFYTTKPPGKGTGLGLTIASEIVKKYGGALSVQSTPGQGATFFMRFRK